MTSYVYVYALNCVHSIREVEAQTVPGLVLSGAATPGMEWCPVCRAYVGVTASRKPA